MTMFLPSHNAAVAVILRTNFRSGINIATDKQVIVEGLRVQCHTLYSNQSWQICPL